MNDDAAEFAGGMDEQTCYAWGDLFDSSWDDLVRGMAERAVTAGLAQEVAGRSLVWRESDRERCRWVFVEDPSRIDRIREIFNDDANAASPACHVVVRQPDPNETRGDVVFDIFRLSPPSYISGTSTGCTRRRVRPSCVVPPRGRSWGSLSCPPRP